MNSTITVSPLEPLFHGNAALTDESITAARANTPVSLALTALDAAQAKADEQRAKAQAAGLYAATIAYDAALAQPNPSAALDSMTESVADIVPMLCKALGVDANTEFAEALGTSITDRMWAFNAIEFARAECGPGYDYVFDLLGNGVRSGHDPHIARQTALDVPKRLRENAEAAR